MGKKHQLKTIALALALGLVILTGCERSSATVSPLATEAPTAENEENAVETTPGSYPSTPEDVIEAFLISYPVDAVYAIQFLSPALVKNLDVDSVSKLLPGTGEIKGFIIESGATSAEAERSEILASIAFEDLSAQVAFHLEIVDGRWVIHQIK